MFFVFGLSFSFKPSPMLILLSSRSSLRLSIHCSVGLLFCSFPGSLCAELQTTQYDHRLFSILHTCPIKPSQYVSSDPFYCVIFQPDSLSDIYFFLSFTICSPQYLPQTVHFCNHWPFFISLFIVHVSESYSIWNFEILLLPIMLSCFFSKEFSSIPLFGTLLIFLIL